MPTLKPTHMIQTFYLLLQFMFMNHVSSSIEDLQKLLDFERNIIQEINANTSQEIASEYLQEIDYE